MNLGAYFLMVIWVTNKQVIYLKLTLLLVLFFLLLISLDLRKESSSCIPTPHHLFSLYQNTWLFEGIANELLRPIVTELSISLFITKSGIRLNLTLFMWRNSSHFWQLSANKQNIYILKNTFGPDALVSVMKSRTR